MVIILFHFKNKEIKDLFQWSRDIVLEFDQIYAGEEAHFSNNKINSLNKKIDDNGEVTIPNILLTESMLIEVYLFIKEGPEQYTKKKKILPVIARPKPEDYIYTEEENKIWDNKVDIFQGEENSKKILSTNENGKVVTEISTDEIITNKDIPLPTSADNGKYLGCENGAATWKPVDLPSGGAEEFELLTKNVETGEAEPIVMDAETLRYNFPSLADYKKLLIIIKKKYKVTTGLTGDLWFRYNSTTGFIFNPSYANSYVEIDASLPGLCALKYLTSNNLQILNTPYNGTYSNVNSFESPYWTIPNTDWAEYYANCNTTITILGVRR